MFGMVDAVDRARFAQEQTAQLGAVRGVGAEQFDGAQPIDEHVAREVDVGDRTFAEQRDEAITVREHLADPRRAAVHGESLHPSGLVVREPHGRPGAQVTSSRRFGCSSGAALSLGSLSPPSGLSSLSPLSSDVSDAPSFLSPAALAVG
jgi:hypothetical protein